MTALDNSPFFSSEAQEAFTEGCRVFLVADTPILKEGAEGTYAGHVQHARLAVIDWDTPSGKPYRVAVPFDALKNLYR